MATTTAGQRLTEQHRRAQEGLAALVATQLGKVWHLLDPQRLEATTGAWLDAALRIVTTNHAASAQIAGRYYKALRTTETGAVLDRVQSAQLRRRAAVTSLVVNGPVRIRRATGSTPATFQHMVAMAETETARAGARHVLEGGREVIRQTTVVDRGARGWRRVTSGKACKFCQMLAGRGAVYTQDTVDFQAHDGCHCMPEPVFDSSPTRTPAPTPMATPEVVEPEAVEEAPVDQELASFSAASQRLVDAAPKKYKQLFADGAAEVDRILADVPEPMRRRFSDLMGRMEDFKVTTISGPPRGHIVGSFGTSRFGVTPGRFPQLRMETRRINEEWQRWQADPVGQAPPHWRTARRDEIASTLTHELTHAHDYWAKLDPATGQTAQVSPRVSGWIRDGHHNRFKLLSVGNPDFAYGSSSPGEGIAEATRMYLHGLEGRPTATGWVGQETAAVWRVNYPELARAVEEIVWGF